MKCPLTYFDKLESYQGRDYGVLDCLKEECAWWNDLYVKCDPTGLVASFWGLIGTLAEIECKMPHAEQFTK